MSEDLQFKVIDPWITQKNKPTLPQCEGILDDLHDRDTQCRNRGKVNIEGKNYCRAHAGAYLLNLLALGEYTLAKKQ